MTPDDRLVLGWQLALPRDFSPYSGSTFNDDTSPIGPNMSLLPGKGKLILYGSFLRDGREQAPSYNQNLSSNAIHQVVGNDPVSDQFEVAPNSAYFGSMAEHVVTGTMKPGDDGQGVPRTQDGIRIPGSDVAEIPSSRIPFFAARGVQIEFTGQYQMDTRNSGHNPSDRKRSNRKTNLANFFTNAGSTMAIDMIYPQTVSQFDFTSFGSIKRTIRASSNEIYYDSTAGTPVEYHLTDGKKAIRSTYSSAGVYTVSYTHLTLTTKSIV